MKTLLMCIMLLSNMCVADFKRIEHILFVDVWPVIDRITSADKERAKDVQCLATMVYGEARGEPVQGLVAVAYTAKNRGRLLKRGVCDIVLQPYQYSVFNGNKHLRSVALSVGSVPKSTKTNLDEANAWHLAKKIAEQVLISELTDTSNGATHYISPSCLRAQGYRHPKWAAKKYLVQVIENHHFYRLM